MHRRTHDNFKKKDYRLLNSENNQIKKGKVLGKRVREENDVNNDEKILTQEKEVTKCAQVLSENWTPLKRPNLEFN